MNCRADDRIWPSLTLFRRRQNVRILVDCDRTETP